MKYSAIFVLLLVLMGLASARSETVAEIIGRIEHEKIAALTAYLAAHPDASDSDAARAHLVMAHNALGNTAEVAALLEARYESAGKGSDADLRTLFGAILQPLLEAYRAQGDKDKARSLLDRAEKDTAGHPMAPQIGQFLGQLRGELAKPSVGDTLDIAFTDVENNSIDLAAMKGKVVLVDFWATWCGPCVAEMPNVVAAYNQYHAGGFEIIGISLDQDKGALQDFVRDNKMPWPQYFDGKGWQNELAGRHGITAIPATFLVGKDGKIAATDLRGEELAGRIAELLK